jgi:hypothetical protein
MMAPPLGNYRGTTPAATARRADTSGPVLAALPNREK